MIKAGGSSEMGQFLAHFATIVSIGHRPPCNHCRKNFQKQSKATLPPTRATRKLQCCYFWQIFQPWFRNFQKYFNPALQTFKNISAMIYKLSIMLDFPERGTKGPNEKGTFEKFLRIGKDFSG